MGRLRACCSDPPLLGLGIVWYCDVKVAEGKILEQLNFKRARDFVDHPFIHFSNWRVSCSMASRR